MTLDDLLENKQNPISTEVPVLRNCPECASPNLSFKESTQTLLHSNSAYDINHHWYSYICRDCGENTVLEYKGQSDGYNWWLTRDGHCISGISSCWEKNTYTCKCGGKVRIKNLSTEDDKPTRMLSYDFKTGTKSYYEYWVCDTCDNGVKLA